MNTSSEAAEQVIRISLQGIEVAARLTGSGAKNVAALLVAFAKDKQKVRGKTTLTNMLKSGRPLKVFSIKNEDLKKFSDEAKKYGVLFSAIVDKNTNDGMIDILVREDDAAKINRIVERFKLATVDMAVINSEIEKIKEEKAKAYEPASNKQKNLTESKEKPISKEKNESLNPNLGKVKKDRQLEPSLMNKNNLENSTENKPSVREEIKKIKNELNKVTKHKHIKNKGRKRTR